MIPPKEICTINSIFLFVVDSCSSVMGKLLHPHFGDEKEVSRGKQNKRFLRNVNCLWNNLKYLSEAGKCNLRYRQVLKQVPCTSSHRYRSQSIFYSHQHGKSNFHIRIFPALCFLEQSLLSLFHNNRKLLLVNISPTAHIMVNILCKLSHFTLITALRGKHTMPIKRTRKLRIKRLTLVSQVICWQKLRLGQAPSLDYSKHWALHHYLLWPLTEASLSDDVFSMLESHLGGQVRQEAGLLRGQCGQGLFGEARKR